MSLKIIRSGILDTVQDNGRWGYQHLGINPGGSMDRFSASLANALLGKEATAPVIELHFPAAEILFTAPCVICLTGADFLPTLNGTSVPLHQPLFVGANSVLEFKTPKSGARCYLALLNEWRLNKWLNSYSTHTKVLAGGYKGRRLLKGDEIELEPVALPQIREERFSLLPWHYHPLTSDSKEVEFIVGNEWNRLTTKSQTDFLNQTFRMTAAADRMGYRLQGEVLQTTKAESLLSSAVGFGTIQLLPSGQLIVLMADHQTTGGYPRIGHVISAHLPKLAQQRPGDEIKFTLTTLEEAEEKLTEQLRFLKQTQSLCQERMDAYRKAPLHR